MPYCYFSLAPGKPRKVLKCLWEVFNGFLLMNEDTSELTNSCLQVARYPQLSFATNRFWLSSMVIWRRSRSGVSVSSGSSQHGERLKPIGVNLCLFPLIDPLKSMHAMRRLIRLRPVPTIWWDKAEFQSLNQYKLSRLDWVQQNYLTNDYCKVTTRYPTPPPECSLNP